MAKCPKCEEEENVEELGEVDCFGVVDEDEDFEYYEVLREYYCSHCDHHFVATDTRQEPKPELNNNDKIKD